MTINDAPTSATDAVNKAYADSIAAGLDPKESVYTATDPGEDLLTGSYTGTYSSSGGPNNSGEFTNVDLTVAIGGVVANTLGLRVLVKDESSGTNPAYRNGIYEVTATGVTGTLTRAADQDGTPANEVSAGNFTFVEQGNNANSGWVVTGNGVITLNAGNINWTQFTGAGSFTAGIGLDQSGNTLFLDVDDLTVETIASADTIAFHDATSSPSGTDSGTRKTTLANLIVNGLILTTAGASGGNIGGTDGVLFNTTTNNMELDITNLSDTAVVGADEMVFDDGASGSHIKRTVADFLTDRNIANRAYTSSGFMTHTADDTWGVATIGASTDNDELGINVVNGDGSGNATIGLDVVNLTPLGAAPASTDELFVVDDPGGTPINKKMTVANLSSAVAGATNIGDLADVVADSSSDAAGNVLVADGTDSYDTKKIQHIESVTSQTSVTVNHNIGQKFVIVQCYDSSDVMVVPNSVTLTDANNTAVTFSPAFTGNIVVMGIPGVV